MTACLLEQIKHHPGDAPALQYCQGAGEPLVSISYQQLIQTALLKRQQASKLYQQAVTLPYQHIEDFISSLLAYDGFCSALYLLPAQGADLPVDDSIETTSTDDATPSAAQHALASNWYLATSGTTGKPKWIQHSLQKLTKTVNTKATSRDLCWGLVYQPYRFAGLQVVLQSLLSGACLVDVSDGEVEQRLNVMSQAKVNALSATPSLWRQFLFSSKLAALPLQQLTLGGEIADQPLLNTLQQLFPGTQLRHIYASTEAGVAFAVTDGKAGFPRRYLEQGYYDLQLKVDQQQHLWLKGPAKYAPELANRVDSDGFLDTEDLVRLSAERVLFLGRASGVINVGGNKVHPEQVEQVILEVPGIVAARVYGKHSSILGQLVMAQIVASPATDEKELVVRVTQHCQQQLQRHQLPLKFNF
ncbi:AMP-binding protein [Arsukibacterium sp.]|uniref:AMP-binding protein n=1 Tax=Arsukibacterium sp. TaxID=1977258 RepID=UPI001BD286BC|nr:AMP-binding protein [Arsukibacterium sp.]